MKRRRASWVEQEARVAEKSRDGFQKGVVRGMMGMALAGLTNGKFTLGGEPVPPWKRIPTSGGVLPRAGIPARKSRSFATSARAKSVSLHGALMDKVGWPAIPFDGQLLVSHQDALLMGGKVQAPPGYADHVIFLYPELCQKCGTQDLHRDVLRPGHHARRGRRARFRPREMRPLRRLPLELQRSPYPDDPERMNIAFRAGAGGLHSAEN